MCVRVCACVCVFVFVIVCVLADVCVCVRVLEKYNDEAQRRKRRIRFGCAALRYFHIIAIKARQHFN